MVFYSESQAFAANPLMKVSTIAAGAGLPLAWSRGGPGATTPILFAAAVIGWMLTVRLETEVRDDALALRFRRLWFPKTFQWPEIERVEAIRYRPILQYGGWGIRRSWTGEPIWNVSGNRGVRLHLRNGKTFVVGSSDAERLAEAIRSRLGAAASSANRLL
jgi:hypothetical protein